MNTFRAFHAFQSRFPDEEACLQYLVDKRWSGRPVCPKCHGHRGRLLVARRAWACSATRCGYHLSILRGTIFAGTKKPLTTWFEAAWWYVNAEGVLTASQLQVLADLQTHQTARIWLRKLRHAAAQLFLEEVAKGVGTAARLQPALTASKGGRSCLPLIHEVCEQVRRLDPALGSSGRRWRVCLAAWSQGHGHRRASPTSFPERALELGFRLVVRSFCRWPSYFKALARVPEPLEEVAPRYGGAP